MAELHELLAAEKDAKAGLDTARRSFIENCVKVDKMEGMSRSLQMFDAERAEFENVVEGKDMETTFASEVEQLKTALVKAFDLELQKDTSNCYATADIKLEDGTIVAADVPATFLVYLERQLEALRTVLEKIPTRNAVYNWEESQEHDPGIFKALKDATFKTEKKHCHKVMVEPTDKHPAQVHEWTEDQKVGKYTTQLYSSLISVRDKRALLARLEDRITAVKKARARANKAEANTRVLAEEILGGIL